MTFESKPGEGSTFKFKFSINIGSDLPINKYGKKTSILKFNNSILNNLRLFFISQK